MKRIYPNLAAEMARKNITQKDIAKVLGVKQQTISGKLTGKTEFSIKDAFRIRDSLFPTLMVDYLFDTRLRYDLIDVFNFPDKIDHKNPFESDNGDPDDCA
jgi:transcriptional regulator with XRE-family HTH domain